MLKSTLLATAIGVLLSPLATVAQTLSAAAESIATYDFNIPTQPLARAINALAEQSNLQVLYSDRAPLTMTAPEVRGRMTAEQALTTLLAGSGYTFRFARQGVVTLEKITSVERVLGPVRVEGTEQDDHFGRAGQKAGVNGINGSRDITATEGTGSFTSGALTIGSKAPQAMKDIPQSLSVITAERLEQQNINDFTQVLAQAPGITLTRGATSLDTVFYSRGFQINSIQIDGGAPLTTSFASGSPGFFPQIDLSQYDHVELLRGAAGLFNGYGFPSGTVNLVRKQPLDHEQVTLDAQVGSWKNYRTVLDATAPLALDGKLRGRLVTTWQSNEYFYDLAEDQKTMLYGIVSYDVSPDTLLSVGVSNTRQDSKPWHSGLPRYQTGEDLHLPRETSFVFPWNRWDFETTEIVGSIEQRLGANWTAKLNVTQNQQQSERKLGYTQTAVNPIDNRGPRMQGIYDKYASDQLTIEGTLAGAFTVFGQRQEILIGANRSDQDAAGRTEYQSLISGTAATPYQPYAGGPLYCSNVSICPTGTVGPLINVFDFDPYDPRYTEPRNTLPNRRYTELGQIRTLAYASIRLTAFDRVHLATGLRWSRNEHRLRYESLCVNLADCPGRQIGDVTGRGPNFFNGEDFAWPPAISLSYDLTNDVTTYLGYTDIYQDQSNYFDADLEPLGPITGDNIELGVKWAARDGRLNATLGIYHIERQGYFVTEPNQVNRYKRNPDGTYPRDGNGNFIVITNNGTELGGGFVGPNSFCCYVQDPNRVEISEGIDAEVTGELSNGWQISASYTFSQTDRGGSTFAALEGTPFTTIQPRHIYKLWTSYNFRAAGHLGWLSNVMLSGGINGQSKSYQSGSVCPDDQVGQPNALTGIAPCLVSAVPYDFTVEPYSVFSGRIDYRLNETWSASLNLENILDKTYYQSVASVSSGNWYGTPRSITLSFRAKL